MSIWVWIIIIENIRYPIEIEDIIIYNPISFQILKEESINFDWKYELSFPFVLAFFEYFWFKSRSSLLL